MSNGLPPRPANTVFGMTIDGKVSQIAFQSLVEAEEAGQGLANQGRAIAIFDKVTNKVIKRLSKASAEK